VRDTLFYASIVIAIAGFAVAMRFLYLAWSDLRIGRNRRSSPDRRKKQIPVPMERRRRQRRQ
jgi:hypothetical protein